MFCDGLVNFPPAPAPKRALLPPPDKAAPAPFPKAVLFVEILPELILFLLNIKSISSVVPIKFVAALVPAFPVKLHALLLNAKEAVTALDEETANEADVAKELLIDVVANELDSADVAKEAVPNNEPVNAVEVNEVNPVIVVAVAPNDIEVDPTVTELFAKFAFVIPAVPLKLALVNPEIEPPSVNDPEEVTVPVNVIPDTVP